MNTTAPTIDAQGSVGSSATSSRVPSLASSSFVVAMNVWVSVETRVRPASFATLNTTRSSSTQARKPRMTLSKLN